MTEVQNIVLVFKTTDDMALVKSHKAPFLSSDWLSVMKKQTESTKNVSQSRDLVVIGAGLLRTGTYSLEKGL